MPTELLSYYLAGIDDLRNTVRGMSHVQFSAKPIAGAWSTLEVLCHLADAEAVFADRMKRILAEDRPEFPFANPELFAPALAYQQRDAEIEVGLIELTRRQIASILQAVPPASLSRCGIHSRDGVCTLEQVLQKAVTHLQHHLSFIQEKRRALGLGAIPGCAAAQWPLGCGGETLRRKT